MFRVTKYGVWVGKVRLGVRCRCDCGETATVLVLPVQLLCTECAIAALESDREAYMWDREARLNRFMGLQEAIETARGQ